MTKIIYLFLILNLSILNSGLATESVEKSEGDNLSTKSNKVQIQHNPDLWLHINVDRNSYTAYAKAWVTQGSADTAKPFAVENITLSLYFSSNQEKTLINQSEIEITNRLSKPCYDKATFSVSTTGPVGHISVSS